MFVQFETSNDFPKFKVFCNLWLNYLKRLLLLYLHRMLYDYATYNDNGVVDI